jgi:hypothetical protein
MTTFQKSSSTSKTVAWRRGVLGAKDGLLEDLLGLA